MNITHPKILESYKRISKIRALGLEELLGLVKSGTKLRLIFENDVTTNPDISVDNGVRGVAADLFKVKITWYPLGSIPSPTTKKFYDFKFKVNGPAVRKALDIDKNREVTWFPQGIDLSRDMGSWAITGSFRNYGKTWWVIRDTCPIVKDKA